MQLIFYVGSATFTQPTAVPVNRPVASQSQALPERPLIVTVAANGEAWLGDQAWRINDAATIRAALAERSSGRVLVHADGDVPTRQLVAVIDACRAAGAESIDLAADHQGGS